ncbi:MAG TPA: metalloregulator ArsR/SmtB family transcription factor [Solirubrobacteraceae bacterium]|nr:metalloregulator ArsR/SmtB family transcription factor [Solirubrobacteraceae bacterium]
MPDSAPRAAAPAAGDPDAVFGALADGTRRSLLAVLAEHPATATELATEMPISRQAVIKHLNALAEAGLVSRKRSGREVRYNVTPAPLSDAVSWIATVGAQWDDRMAALARAFPGRTRGASSR